MAMTDEIKIEISAQVDKALKGYDKVHKENKKLESSLNDTAGKFQALWAAVSAAIVGGAAKALAGITKSYDEFAQLTQSTSEQFGVSADVIIEKLSQVSGGIVSNKDLVLAANRAMALNVTKDIGKMAELLEYARLRARAMGTDTTAAFNDIVTGIGRQSPLILDNLGIITTGWAEEAAATGKAYDSQFILNKVLEQAGTELENVGELSLTGAEGWQALAAQFENFKEEVGKALSPVIKPIVEFLTKMLSSFSKLPSWVKASAAALTFLTPVVVGVTTAVIALGAALNGAFAGIPAIIAAVSVAVGTLAAGIIAKTKEIKNAVLEDLSGLDEIYANTGIGVLKRDLDAFERQLKDTNARIEENTKRMLDKTGEYSKKTLEYEKQKLETDKQTIEEKIKKINSAIKNAQDKQAKEAEEAAKKQKELEERNNKAKAELNDLYNKEIIAADEANLREIQSLEAGSIDKVNALRKKELQAIERLYKDKAEIVEQSRQDELNKTGLTETEKLAINEKYNNELVNIDRDKNAAIENANEQSNAKIEAMNEETKSKIKQTWDDLVSGITGVLSSFADVYTTIVNAEADAAVEAYNDELEAYEDMLDDKLNAADSASSKLKEISDTETQENIDNLKLELAEAVAAGDEALAAEKQREIDKLELQREADEAEAEAEELKAAKQKEIDDKIKEEKTEAAKKEKKVNVAKAIIEGIISVAKSIAESPLTFGLPWSAINAAASAANVAAIEATPIPTYADGGIVKGPTIAQIGDAGASGTGAEAVIPLKNGAVPVTLTGKGGETVVIHGNLVIQPQEPYYDSWVKNLKTYKRENGGV